MGTNTYNYVGVAANFDTANPFSIDEPASGDPRSSASVREPLEPLADATQNYREFGARINAENIFSALQTFNGASGDTNFALATSAAPSGLKGLWSILNLGSLVTNVYSGSFGLMITINATYDGVTGFTRQTNTVPAYFFEFNKSNGLKVYYYDATASASWDVSALSTVATIKWDTVAPLISTSGKIKTTAGDIEATAGSISAGGTVSGSSGPGLVKAKRYYETGTKPTNTQFNLTNFDAANPTTILGSDGALYVKITAGAAPAAGNGIVQLTFKDDDWTTTPVNAVLLQNTNDPGFPATAIPVTWSTTTTTVIWTMHRQPQANKYYEFVVLTRGTI